MSAESSPEICRFFLSGTCRYGSNCRYAHKTACPAPSTSKSLALKWLNAPEFVPKEMLVDDEEEEEDNINVITSYADVCRDKNAQNEVPVEVIMCPYIARDQGGVCVYGDTCEYVHGDLCDLCGQYCLNPVDEEKRKRHMKECMEQHEKDMELSFAVARSKDKCCGICMEVVLEKGADQRFGILQNCNHVFCLECIRKWRQNKEKNFNNEIARSCPECRTPSDFICPSTFWVGDIKEEKDKLINGYKNALSDKHCKYFKNGDGKCPFGNKCFYKHVDKLNQKVDCGDPKKFVRRRYNQNGDLGVFEEYSLMAVIESLGRLSTDESDFEEDEDEDDLIEFFREAYSRSMR